jgi:hypothetical protein
MKEDFEKVDLASLYRDLASFSAQEDDKEIKKILKSIKKEASKGKFTLKLKVSEDIYNWVNSPFKETKIKPDLIINLEKYGFSYGNATWHIGIFNSYSITVSWAK